MKKDEMNETTKKSIRKINIDDLPKSDDQTADLKGDTQVWDDLPLEDEFEFHPDYDEMGFFEDDFAKEPVSRKKTSKASEETTSEKTSGKRRIKKIQLTPEEIQERKEVQKKRRSQNPEILAVTYTFVALFVLMIGYFVYFNAFVSKDVINSAYNVRINSFEETVTRGSIVSNDGTVLAETLTDENGNETRYYPMGRIFAHAIGTSEINQSGVELSQNFYMLQSNGNPIWNLIRDIQGEKNPGDRVVTTLDASLQEVAYNALGYNDGAVVAIEPSTGKVLAMVSKPDYNPNTLVSDYESIIADENNNSLLNKATSGLFVPGSIFKTFTSLAYMRSGANTDNYSYLCEGRINLGGDDYITCFNQTVHGEEDFIDSFAYSCNASFGNIGLSLKKDQLKDTCESLFFNNKLPTDIMHKKSVFDLSSDASNWQIAATSIGQGHTQVTPLHMAMVVSAIANGGNLMKPYMVDSIETADGGRRVEKYLPESYGQIMTTQEANALGELMEAVTSYGTAYSLSDYGYSVAGKTGTAEVAGKGDNSWFVGYAPADQPKIAICVLVENDEGYYESALPVANAIFQNYMNR
ncbi:peptidoglycan D,D-transpeptidase FtsI family protein [Frisingicoccus sp.]|uniref:peptidoglycan D,D-transpeptidase FtsI family protein n=1 Tax=Frisingicoccus sp. TaxID=1918627 RepID=UPI002EBD3414|nr:penicillin-binding transpeptidase domain-containing protein [Frisingicoccus sp.]